MAKHWTEIQGWLSEAEGGELQMLAAGKTVLEIGAWKGRSTICLASVAKHVVTVDHFKGDGYTGAAFTLPDFVRTLADYDCRDRVTAIAAARGTCCPYCVADTSRSCFTMRTIRAKKRHSPLTGSSIARLGRAWRCMTTILVSRSTPTPLPPWMSSPASPAARCALLTV